MRAIRNATLIGAALLASVSYWPQWPGQAWHWLTALPQWLASLSYEPNWPLLVVLWFLCPDINFLGGGCGHYTTHMILVRVLAGSAPVVAAGVVYLIWKSKKRRKAA